MIRRWGKLCRRFKRNVSRSFSLRSAETPPTSEGTTTGSSALLRTQIAVVGSGPSGCYVAQQLTKKREDVHVDIYERLPVPFGLCRYGVAPDHPDVKSVEQQFMEMFRSGRVTWIGNVDVGKHLPIEVLLKSYAAVVLATGADNGRKLNIPGEDLAGVVRACDFVRYYNTYPLPYGSPRFCPFPLHMARDAVIIGNGNVALDCARVLASPYKYFCPTDMNCAAIKELMQNRIQRIQVVGRRGPEHSAFTIAEFRELTKYQPDAVKVVVDSFNLEEALRVPSDNSRARRRLLELMARYVSDPEAGGSSGLEKPASVRGPRGPCKIQLRYNMRPVRFLPSREKRGHVGAVVFERTNFASGDDGRSDATSAAPPVSGSAISNNTDMGMLRGNETTKTVTIPCDVVIISVGYHGENIPGVEFDHTRGIISHVDGRVKDQSRLYCVGWVKNGPKGKIAHALIDAQQTAANIINDLNNNLLPSGSSDGCFSGKFGMIDFFVEKRFEPVSVSGLERIMLVEKERGVDLGKRLEKIDSVRSMLDVALGGTVGKKACNAIRGIMNERPDALLYLNELLDDTTDLAPLAKRLARDLPPVMASQHPPGRLHPSQL
uniref:Ferredoxin NADP+ reductase-like protein n=1 Tax=Trypanosoma congolense (strain IL3000) TaxID=1068625 RepID=G0UVK9_TRYCI|nr:ferredoxin NADP+ reductase-like protein [Trypanosoma congolense IL3000]